MISDTTFYALWKDDPDTYTVTFEANGGSAL